MACRGSLVRDRLAERAARRRRHHVRAVIDVAGVPPRHRHRRRPSGAPVVRGRGRIGSRPGRRTGLDGIRGAGAAAAPQRFRHRPDRRGRVGRMASAGDLVGKQQHRRNGVAGGLSAGDAVLVPAALPGADGVGARPHRESARGDADAREPDGQCAQLRSDGDLGPADPDLQPVIGRGPMGRGRGHHHC